MCKTIKILNMVFNLLASSCAFCLVILPMGITFIGGIIELLFTQDADTFGPMFIATSVGMIFVILTFIPDIAMCFVSKKNTYVILGILVDVTNLAVLIIFTILMAGVFGDNLGEDSEVYSNLALLYGPAIFGICFCIVTIFLTILVALKSNEEWLASFAKKNEIVNNNVYNNANNLNNINNLNNLNNDMNNSNLY